MVFSCSSLRNSKLFSSGCITPYIPIDSVGGFPFLHPLHHLLFVQFSSVPQSCLTLCDPMDCSMPGLPIHCQLPEFTQTHVHGVSDAIQTSHSVVPFSSCFQSFPASGSFQMSQFFTSGGQSIGVSASASVPSSEYSGLISLGWTGWISLQSKGLSRVFSNTTVQKHNSSALSFLYGSTLTTTRDYWKNCSFD